MAKKKVEKDNFLIHVFQEGHMKLLEKKETDSKIDAFKFFKKAVKQYGISRVAIYYKKENHISYQIMKKDKFLENLEVIVDYDDEA